MAKHRAELDETQVDVQLRETEQRRAVLACADNIIMPIIAADGSTNSPGPGNASNADCARVEGRVAAACPKASAAAEDAGLFARLTTPNKVHGALCRRGRHGRRRHNSVGSRSIRTLCTARRTSDPRYERAHRWMPPGTPAACAVSDLPIPLRARRNPPF